MTKIKFHDVSPEVQYTNLLKKGRWYTVYHTNHDALACVLGFSPMQSCLWLAQNSADKKIAEYYAMGMMHACEVNVIVSRRIILQ